MVTDSEGAPTSARRVPTEADTAVLDGADVADLVAIIRTLWIDLERLLELDND